MHFNLFLFINRIKLNKKAQAYRLRLFLHLINQNQYLGHRLLFVCQDHNVPVYSEHH